MFASLSIKNVVRNRMALLPVLGAMALVVHTALVFRHFPIQTARAGNPVSSVDLAFHLASAMEGHDFIAERGKLSGYSPRYMAGYRWGLWDSVGTRGYEMSSTVFPMCSVGMAYHLWIMLTAWLPPIVIALACLLVTSDRWLALLCLVFSTVVYQLGNIVAYFWTSGLIAFTCSSALAVLYAALLWRSLGPTRWYWTPVTGAVLALLFWVHPLGLIPALAVSFSWLAVCHERLIRPWTWVRGTVLALVALVLVLPWLRVLWPHWGLRNPLGLDRMASGIKYFIMDFLSDRRYLYHFDRRSLMHVVVVLAILGCVHARARALPGVMMFGGAALGVLVCTYGFPYMGTLNEAQPYRFLVSAKLFALVPATLGLRELGRMWGKANSPGRWMAVCIGLALLPSLTAYGFDFVYRYRRPAYGLDSGRMKVVEWVRSYPEQPGRVLCEDYRLANVLPYYVNREIIGGSISNESMLPNACASMGLKGVFGPVLRPKLAREEILDKYLRVYNIGMIIAHSPTFLQDLAQAEHMFCEKVETGGYTFLRVDPELVGPVWNGEMGKTRVIAQADRLIVEGAPAGRFILKYHYADSVHAEPATRIYGAELLGLPVAFLGIDNSNALDRIELHFED